MYEFIEGEIEGSNPSYAVIKTGGIGYFIHISLNTFSFLNNKKHAKLFIHQVIREDAHLLFGFQNTNERDIFRHLISVSGIGANTARMMLSSLSPNDIQEAILKSDLDVLKGIKGIGLKTAQRVIVELKDKMGKADTQNDLFITKDNTNKNEALSALVMLGFAKKNVEKVLDQLTQGKEVAEIKVEDLVKMALKKL
jgi:holliday junction DNA helicase RuvA